MKKLFTVILAVSMSSVAFARLDFKKYSSLDGKSGTGQNAYEEGEFNCSVEIDTQENVLTIVHDGAYESRTIILGDEIVSQSSTSNGIALETEKSSPTKSGLCGDFISAISLQQRLEITTKSVSITTSYKCFLKSHRDVMTCNF